jgi:putative intracellular protease/amidase
MQIVILLYPDMTALDAIGPYEVLARLPEATLTFAAEALGIEYDPQPPFDCGSPEKAAPHVVELVKSAMAR